MKALAIVALLATAAGCQTKQQCVVGLVGGGALFVGGAMLAYDTRNDDEGTLIPATAILAGGVIAILSGINLIAMYNGDDKD